MRFSFVSTLALAAVAAGNPLADKIYKLNDLVNELEQSLANWSGGYTGMLAILMPTISKNTEAFMLISDITLTAKTSGILSEDDANEVLYALTQSHIERPTIENTVIEKKDAFLNLGSGWRTVIQIYASIIGHLSAEGHNAIKYALPEDKKENIEALMEGGKEGLARVNEAYAS